MSSVDVVRVRVNWHLKEEVTRVLARMGLPASNVSRMLLTRIATHKAPPLHVNGARQTVRMKS